MTELERAIVGVGFLWMALWAFCNIIYPRFIEEKSCGDCVCVEATNELRSN